MRLIFLLFLLFQLTAFQSYAKEVEIFKLRKAGSRNSTQIYVSFDDIPIFKHQQSGKRIDIILESSLSNNRKLDFETDDRVVKFLTQEKENQTILTFFLRYEPQRYKVSTPENNTIVLDVLLGNQFTKAYPELSSRLEGVTIVTQEGADFTNPFIASPYAKNWNLFFSSYEPEIFSEAPIQFTLPPFPVIHLLPDTPPELLPTEFYALADQNQWSNMGNLLIEMIQSSESTEDQKLLALTFGEALMRVGNFDGAFKQLYLISNKYSLEPVGIAASYLLTLLRAIHEDPYLADFDFRKLESFLEPELSLSPYIQLSQIESAIASRQYERAKTLLNKDDLAFPPQIMKLKELRLADYWYGKGDFVKSYVGYNILNERKLLDNQPYSLNGFCNTLYHQKKYSASSECYEKLNPTIEDKTNLSDIAFKKAMAELHFKSAREMYVIFSTIEDTFPGTTSSFRAALKKTDIRYLSQPSWRTTSAKYYKALYEKASDRNVAEEAALKEAIVYSQIGQTSKSIERLMEFLRNFRAGKLKDPALALLIELLPKELESLIDEKDYIQALVLAKKNRSLFQKNWVQIDLLSLLAEAYNELSVYEEARRLYLYLLNTKSLEEKERYYLPLVSILYSLSQFDLVEDYSTEYNYNYPQGQDSGEIFLLRLKSLVADNKINQAMEMISDPLPDMQKLREIAAMLHFKKNNFQEVIELLSPYLDLDQLPAEEYRYMLAESYYQTDKFNNAHLLFEGLSENKKFSDQSLFRIAYIYRYNNQNKDALKLFSQIVEKGNDPLWKKLAARELEYNRLTTSN